MPALVGLFLTLTTLAWVYGTPPGAGYDEVAHYIKAVGVGQGQLAGSPFRVHRRDRALERLGEAFAPSTGARDPRYEWLGKTRREFEIPRQLTVREDTCGVQPISTCVELRPSQVSYARSYVGTYQPFAYLGPGLAARAANAPGSAIRAGRLANAALCVALLALAGFVLWDRGAGTLALIGLIAALSPAVLYAAATINPSGPEIAAGACFGSALLALTRPEQAFPGRKLAVLALGGIVLALCRPLGPLLIVLTMLAVAALRGRAGVRAAHRYPHRPLLAVAGLITVACVANLAWEFRYQPRPEGSARDIGPGISDALHNLPSLAKQFVGLFGELDLGLPLFAYVGWALLVAAVIGLALRIGTRRERLALGALIAAVGLLLFGLNVAQHPTGFAVQARYVLPIAVLVPVAAGEVARKHGRAISQNATGIYIIATCCLAAGVHLTAWVVNARHWDTNVGAAVAPPGGWLLWAVVLAAGQAALVAGGLAAARESARGSGAVA